MKKGWASRHRHYRALAILFALIIVGAGLALPRGGRADLTDLPYRLTPGMTSSIGGDLRSVSASDSLIVWEDRRSGAPDVYIYDFNDDREFRASTENGYRRQPDVFGSTIVWASGEAPDQRTIRGIDLAEGVEFAITEEADYVDRPVISDELIAWQRRENGQWSIVVMDRTSGETTTLGDPDGNSARPSVSGSIVTWQEHDGESWNIRAHNMETGESLSISNSDDNDEYPQVAGERIVFVRATTEDSATQLVVNDVDSGSEQVLSNEHYVQRPAINGDLVVWEDWRSGLPDLYAYDLARDEEFAVARSQQANAPAIGEGVIAWVSGNDPANQRVQSLDLQERLPTDPQDPPAVPSPDQLYVPETQHYISGGFKDFWQAHGGPQAFGYPLTEEFVEEHPESGEEIIVQYFERVKLEFHPDAPEDNRIRLALLGYELRPDRETAPSEPFENDEMHRYFEETGHGISTGFKEYWEQNGGLGVFGFPITGEFTENGRTVQYFERARFEYDPEAEGSQVRLGLLGREALQERGWLPLPPIDTTQIFE